MSVSFSPSRASISSFEDKREIAEGKEEIEIVEDDSDHPINGTTVTQKYLVTIAARIEKAIDEADNDLAIREAGKFYQNGLAYVRQDTGEIPLQITFKTIKLLTRGEIQFSDSLKEQLSTICSLFAERVLHLINDAVCDF